VSGRREGAGSAEAENGARIQLADPVDLLMAEARAPEAAQRIVVGGRERVVAANEEPVDRYAAREVSQGLASCRSVS
jgi:hypothetical protein